MAGHPAYRYRHGWIPLNPTAFAAQVERDAKAAAHTKITAAKAVEPHLTSTMQKLADHHGGHLTGLDFRLKTEDSLARKIASRVKETKPPPPTTPAQVAEQMFDVNRYTTVFSAPDYAKKSSAALDELRGQGYTLNVKNYWTVPDNPYKGINVQVKAPDGHQFEVQFHTPESLAVKEGELHRLYELRRVETDPEKAAKLDAEMFAVSQSITDPPSVRLVEAGNRYTPREQEAGSVEVRETAVISERAAASAKATGKMLVQFISPGWGSSGYYSPEVLAEAASSRVIPAGTHMYADHPTEDDDRKRPERSIRDLMAVTTSDAQVASNGALVGEVRVVAPYQELLTDLKDHIGVSIRGDATDVTEGLAEGRKGRIIEGLAHVSSVDFVTRPGRGGQVLALLESAAADTRAVEVLPDAWLTDGIHVELAEALEEVITSPAGAEGTAKLHAYWRHGEGAAKIRWGVPGDFQRCVDHLSKYIADPKGYCAKMHKDVTGFTPGHAPGETHESATVEEREFSSGQRAKMADKGHAMSDGSFPIATVADLRNAVQALGRAKNPDAAKRHIIKRARALGAVGSLPDSWGVKESDVPATRPDSTTTIEETLEVTMGKIQIEESEHTRLVEEAGRVDALASERDTEKARADELAAKLAEVEAAKAAETGTPATPPADKRNPRQLIEAQLADQKHEIAVLTARERARDIVGEELAEAWVAPSTVARLSSDLLSAMPLVDGKLDEIGLRNRCVEARNRAELEAAETLDAAGLGTPRGMGGLPTPAGGDATRYTDTIAENLQVFGLSESAAKAASKGR